MLAARWRPFSPMSTHPTGREAREVSSILSNGAQFKLRDMVVADPDLIGETVP